MLALDIKDVKDGRYIMMDGGLGSGIEGHHTASQERKLPSFPHFISVVYRGFELKRKEDGFEVYYKGDLIGKGRNREEAQEVIEKEYNKSTKDGGLALHI